MLVSPENAGKSLPVIVKDAVSIDESHDGGKLAICGVEHPSVVLQGEISSARSITDQMVVAISEDFQLMAFTFIRDQ